MALFLWVRGVLIFWLIQKKELFGSGISYFFCICQVFLFQVFVDFCFPFVYYGFSLDGGRYET